MRVAMRGLDDLNRDMRRMPAESAKRLVRVVRSNATQGNRTAKAFARVSAGDHGPHYHKAFTVEALEPLRWAYGPDASMKQGNMSFEYGSRNQPPHLDLNRSADIWGDNLRLDARSVLRELFW